MGSTRRAFTPEYKEQSVAFVIDGGRPVAEVARNIGVHEMTLSRWVKVAREAAGSGKSPDAPLGESERAELIRLRGESRDDIRRVQPLGHRHPGRSREPVHHLGAPPGRRHTAEVVGDALVQALAALPAHLRRSLTWDSHTDCAWGRGWA
ncbi:MAG: transposase [Streptosporangiaceae bacterium]